MSPASRKVTLSSPLCVLFVLPCAVSRSAEPEDRAPSVASGVRYGGLISPSGGGYSRPDFRAFLIAGGKRVVRLRSAPSSQQVQLRGCSLESQR